MDKQRATYVTKLGQRKFKAGFLWNEETITLIKIAAAKAHMTESAWTEAAVLAELEKPQEHREKKNPFDLT